MVGSLALAAARLPAAATNGSAVQAPLLVGYFGQWGVYDHIFVKSLLTSGSAAALDQINYAQGFVTGGHCSIADPDADLNMRFSAEDSVDNRADDPASAFRGNLHQLVLLKQRYPRLKILISLEGRASDFAVDAQPANRAAFVASCVDTFLRGHLAPGAEAPNLFDGIDLDWEYPQAEDADNFVALLTDLRKAMNAVRPGLRLSTAVGPSPRMYPGVDMEAVSRLVDQVGIMNYDYNGPWNPSTGLLAPLYSEKGGSVEGSITAYLEAGVPANHILMGLPFYGYGWKEVGNLGHGLFQQGHAIRGDRPYSFFEPLASVALPQPQDSSVAAPLAITRTADAAPTGPGTSNATSTSSAASPSSPAQTGLATTSALPSATTANAPPGVPTAAAVPFTIYRDPKSQAPWLYDGDTFWTFEDPVSVRFKVGFALEQHLGGIMAWELGEDTAKGALVKAARARMEQAAASSSAASAGPRAASR